jgi:hypothetical protein
MGIVTGKFHFQMLEDKLMPELDILTRQNAFMHNQFVIGRSKYFPGRTTGRKPPKITIFKIHLTMLFCYLKLQVDSVKITSIAVSNRKQMAANSLQQACSKNSGHTNMS